ncbi:hypothetical protein FACS1894184_16820 [Clostridia bacterium]|nr:hypothetical protein FACS1894184_16820 [Clostridia bacterium]
MIVLTNMWKGCPFYISEPSEDTVAELHRILGIGAYGAEITLRINNQYFSSTSVDAKGYWSFDVKSLQLRGAVNIKITYNDYFKPKSFGHVKLVCTGDE